MDKLKFVDWVVEYLPKSTKILGELELDPLTGDAGFRQYFRLNTSPALIAVNSPPDKENNSAYVDISLALKAMDIIRPRIYAVDYAQGFLLLEDFGNRHLHSALSLKSIDFRYNQAEELLLSLQKADKGSGKSLAVQYRDEGVNLLREHFTNPPDISQTNGDIKIASGITAMTRSMQKGLFKVFRSCYKWQEEFQQYHFGDNGKIVDKADDLMSATRYAYQSQRYATVEKAGKRKKPWESKEQTNYKCSCCV